jgi:FkbM family methyltransferase
MVRSVKIVLGVFLATAVGLAGLRVRPHFNENRRCCGMSFGRNVVVSAQEALGLKPSYSQFGQDKWVTEVVFPGAAGGFFLDVGSGDGTIGSNSKLLEQRGWRGICVDPFPKNMEGRSCQMVKEVVSDTAGQIITFRMAGDIGGIDQALGTWKNKAQQAPAVDLTTVTLADVLARANAPREIQYMSLDIEGAELAALQGFPFDRYTVGAMTIEHNYEEPKRSRIKAFLESRGYRRVFESTLDDFYVHESVGGK